MAGIAQVIVADVAAAVARRDVEADAVALPGRIDAAIGVEADLHGKHVVAETRAVAEDAAPIAVVLAVGTDDAAPSVWGTFRQRAGRRLLAHALVQRVEDLAPVDDHHRRQRRIEGDIGPDVRRRAGRPLRTGRRNEAGEVGRIGHAIDGGA